MYTDVIEFQIHACQLALDSVGIRTDLFFLYYYHYYYVLSINVDSLPFNRMHCSKRLPSPGQDRH